MRPNVVLILADDLGYGEVGVYGQSKIRTPNIDRLAERGVRMERFYASSPVCAPTRCSLMTGKHQGHAAIRNNKGDHEGWGLNEGEGQMPLPQTELSLPKLLQQSGYATGAFGKWGLGGPGTEGHPLHHGFDTFFGYLCQRHAHNYFPTHLWRDHTPHILEKNRYFAAHALLNERRSDYEAYKGSQYSADEIEREMLDWVRAQDGPFFLYHPTTLPHCALQAPEDLIESYPRDWDENPYSGENGYVPTDRPRATYAAMVTHLDRTVGRLIDLLRERGELENTLFIFTSDNGTSYNGGVDHEFFDSLGGLRGMKGDAWEGGVRVPTVVAWPGSLPEGRVDSTFGAMHDLLPTALAAAGLDVPSDVDGVDLLPAWRGEGGPDREGLYFEFKRMQAITLDDRWKAVRPDVRASLDIELYDLLEDPGESQDVADQHPDVVRRAEACMAEWRTCSEDFPVPELDAVTRAAAR